MERRQKYDLTGRSKKVLNKIKKYFQRNYFKMNILRFSSTYQPKNTVTRRDVNKIAYSKRRMNNCIEKSFRIFYSVCILIKSLFLRL